LIKAFSYSLVNAQNTTLVSPSTTDYGDMNSKHINLQLSDLSH